MVHCRLDLAANRMNLTGLFNQEARLPTVAQLSPPLVLTPCPIRCEPARRRHLRRRRGTVINVTPQDVPVFQQWIGSLDGSTNARFARRLRLSHRQNIGKGASSRRGMSCFKLTARIQAALDQANAQLDVAKAQLEKTDLDVKRLAPLRQQNAVSQEELDDAKQANLRPRRRSQRPSRRAAKPD